MKNSLKAPTETLEQLQVGMSPDVKAKHDTMTKEQALVEMRALECKAMETEYFGNSDASGQQDGMAELSDNLLKRAQYFCVLAASKS